MPVLPVPAHAVFEDSVLHDGGSWTYVHSLAVHLPRDHHTPKDFGDGDGEDFDCRETWTDVFYSEDGAGMLVVNMATDAPELHPSQMGVMTGELVEEWVRFTISLN